MSNSSYVSQLEDLVRGFLEMFEYGPDGGFYTYENEDGDVIPVSQEHEELIDRANDLLYEVESDGVGYPTEEGE